MPPARARRVQLRQQLTHQHRTHIPAAEAQLGGGSWGWPVAPRAREQRVERALDLHARQRVLGQKPTRGAPPKLVDTHFKARCKLVEAICNRSQREVTVEPLLLGPHATAALSAEVRRALTLQWRSAKLAALCTHRLDLMKIMKCRSGSTA